MRIQGHEQLVEKMKKMKKNALAFLFIIGCFTLFGQSSIRGLVTDQATGETLPGVKITLEGTQKITLTDFDGKFNFNGIPEGNYSITAKYATYTTKTITDVGVKTGEPTILNIAMGSAVSEQQEVVVTATMKKESNSALLLAQKNATTVSDGISAESIKRTPDRSTSDVLKRISGASIQDNKFAVIRGLNDRYNAAYINGAPLPSSESDRKAFSFDIFPANMLDNLVIIKTATPELPGEFAGGIIQINTKSIPEDNFQTISIGGGYNTITTGKEKMTYKGGKLDWLGIDDGTRKLPSAIPLSKSEFPSKLVNQAILAKNINTNWELENRTILPNMNFQYSIGRNLTLFNKPFGVIGALNYNRTNVFSTTIRNTYDNGDKNTSSILTNSFSDNNTSTQVMAGSLLNLSYKLSDNNQLSFKNLYSINSEDRFINRTGEANIDQGSPFLIKSNARWFTSNNIFTSQLIGDHYLPTSKIKINWIGSLSTINREIPNLRRSMYQKSKFPDNPSDTMYTANIGDEGVSPSNGGGIFFASTKETIKSFKIDVTYPIHLFKSKLKNDVKIGAFFQDRNREFIARLFGYTKYNSGTVIFDESLLKLGENEIFNQANMGEIKPGIGGFKLIEGTKTNDSYNASSKLNAGYIQLDQKLSNIRLIWGARAEQFTQKLSAIKAPGDTLNINSGNIIDLLPSANLVYSLGEKQNIRLSYYRTLNRPEYRELAPFAFYDFSTQFVLSGNETLKRAKIENLDFRYEIYPGKGQLFSASIFNKNFSNPIEQISSLSETQAISYHNVNNAQNYGVELEFRTLAASLLNTDSSKFLNSLTLFSNFSIIRSFVNFTTKSSASSRPLQGQSPYIFNAGITYSNDVKNFSFSLNANRIGQRIYIVGNVNEPAIWENGRTFIDLQLTKKFLQKKLELKLNIQNILAQDQIFYQNSVNDERIDNSIVNQIVFGNKDNLDGYNKAKDDLIWKTNFGRVFSFSAAYNF